MLPAHPILKNEIKSTAHHPTQLIFKNKQIAFFSVYQKMHQKMFGPEPTPAGLAAARWVRACRSSCRGEWRKK
jgi:hypothetical protein